MRAFILSVIATMLVPAFVLAASPRVEPTNVQPRTQSDVLCFRTFTPDEFGSSAPSDMQDVPLKWTATLTNTAATKVNHLTISFSGKIDNIVSCAPFNRAEHVPGQPLAWDLSGATLSRGATVTIHGVSKTPGLTVLTWKWMYDLRQASRVKGAFSFTIDQLGVEMPTPANVVQNIFQNQSQIRTTSYNQSFSADGIVLGIPRPDSTNSFAWVRLQSPIHTQLTLSARTGYVHTGTPRGLTNTSNGGRLVGEVHFLPPSRHRRPG